MQDLNYNEKTVVKRIALCLLLTTPDGIHLVVKSLTCFVDNSDALCCFVVLHPLSTRALSGFYQPLSFLKDDFD